MQETQGHIEATESRAAFGGRRISTRPIILERDGEGETAQTFRV
jgi:hypothetical protein